MLSYIIDRMVPYRASARNDNRGISFSRLSKRVARVRLHTALLTFFALWCHMSLSANFLWPAVGMYYGFFDPTLWLSIIVGLAIELFCMRYLVPQLPIKQVCMVVLIMNIVSAAFGGVFVTLIDLSLHHLFGISWLWHIVLIYAITALVNVAIESFVCLKFWPVIDKQKLLSVLAVANALSVGVAIIIPRVL